MPLVFEPKALGFEPQDFQHKYFDAHANCDVSSNGNLSADS